MSSTLPPKPLTDGENIAKYKAAAQVANESLAKVFAAVSPGVTVLELCQIGDKAIEEGLITQYRKAKLPRGVAFPTTVSINNVVCHVSPLPSDPEAERKIANGDVVKVQVGAHIDGYAAFTADTIVVGASESSPVVGRRADVVAAAHYAAETIIRMLKPGTNTLDITDAVQKVSQSFGCNPLQSMLSYEQRQNVLEGETQIIFNPIPEQRGEFKKYVIGDNEVYMIDIYMTTGSGKTTKSSIRTTVFKKNEGKPQLRMKAAISLYNEVKSKFGSYPFTTRSIEDERKARSGVLECVKSGLLEPFEVYEDKPEEIVAQLTFTALVQAKGTERITTGGPEFDPNVVKSDKSITDEELLKLLATSVRAKKSKSKKKGSKKSAAADTLE